ncbi:MAG: hypothetical protein D6702_06410 [Planctomycetota bacterium]|nr:MAG: hypothetical protein D6702_06410 [Planctomycetota bacterium]
MLTAVLLALCPQAATPAIGLVPAGDPEVTAALAAGARRALAEAAAEGGPALRLLVAPAPGPWSSTAAAAVELAGRPGVLALISPPEPAAAHAAAQAATRTGVPLLCTSPAASVYAAGSVWVRGVVPVDTGRSRDGSAARLVDPPPPPPGGWEAAGFDAARAVLAALERGARRPREVLAELARGPIPGCRGWFRFDRLGRRLAVHGGEDELP